ncbi:hypothetical protein NKI13_24445 [Mesorhizobium australicum]|uniref:GIY-YIG nuclease family protein n=1 Tax=Mesorhizobium australicum TaxID=536018 RepID=UPI00333D4C3B
MPRKSAGARLYLRKDRDQKVWIIRDNGRDTRTGCGEQDTLGAMRALAEYKNGQPIPIRTAAGMGLVYFVTCMQSPHYPIKIGWSSRKMTVRLEAMQNGNPNLLMTLATAPGTVNDERMLHSYFNHLHVRGEWYRREDDLLEYICSLPGYADSYGADEFAPKEPISVRHPEITELNGLESEQSAV